MIHVGDIVIVETDDGARPAIVTRVHEDPRCLNLQVFPDPTDAEDLGATSGTIPLTNVFPGRLPEHWHLPDHDPRPLTPEE